MNYLEELESNGDWDPLARIHVAEVEGAFGAGCKVAAYGAAVIAARDTWEGLKEDILVGEEEALEISPSIGARSKGAGFLQYCIRQAFYTDTLEEEVRSCMHISSEQAEWLWGLRGQAQEDMLEVLQRVLEDDPGLLTDTIDSFLSLAKRVSPDRIARFIVPGDGTSGQWFAFVDEDRDCSHSDIHFVCSDCVVMAEYHLAEVDGIGIEDPIQYAEEQGYLKDLLQEIGDWEGDRESNLMDAACADLTPVEGGGSWLSKGWKVIGPCPWRHSLPSLSRAMNSTTPCSP